MDTTEQVSISLPRESWQRVHGALLLTAMRLDWPEEAERLLEIAPEISKAGGSALMEAAELEVRESLGVELVA